MMAFSFLVLLLAGIQEVSLQETKLHTLRQPVEMETVTVGPRGKIAYAFQTPKGVRVDSIDETGPEFDAIGEIQFSGRGRLVYLAKEGKRWVVVDSKSRSSPYDSISKIRVSSLGDLVAYTGRVDGKTTVTAGSSSFGPYTSVSELEVSPAGKSFGYIAHQDGKDVVFVDGRETARFEGVRSLIVTDSGSYAVSVSSSDEARVYSDGVLGPPFDLVCSLRYSEQAATFAYVGIRKGEYYVVLGKTLKAPLREVSTFSLCSAGCHVSLVESSDQGMRVVHARGVSEPFPSIERLFSVRCGTPSAFIARIQKGRLGLFVGVDCLGEFERIGGVELSDGKRPAVLSAKMDRHWLVLSGGNSSGPFSALWGPIKDEMGRVSFVGLRDTTTLWRVDVR
jgi:hypothetical protein